MAIDFKWELWTCRAFADLEIPCLNQMLRLGAGFCSQLDQYNLTMTLDQRAPPYNTTKQNLTLCSSVPFPLPPAFAKKEKCNVGQIYPLLAAASLKFGGHKNDFKTKVLKPIYRN